MRATTHHETSDRRRLPKSFRLLRSAIALADECAREMVMNLDAPDLAGTGDRVERIEEERRAVASALEDDLQGTLLSPIDPADLHGFSASISLLTHRTARALYFFNLLGSESAPSDHRALAKLLGGATSELVGLVEQLTSGRTSELGERVRIVRRMRDEAHIHVGKLLAIAPADKMRDVFLSRTVGETLDGAVAQALAVASEALRVATKND